MGPFKSKPKIDIELPERKKKRGKPLFLLPLLFASVGGLFLAKKRKAEAPSTGDTWQPGGRGYAAPTRSEPPSATPTSAPAAPVANEPVVEAPPPALDAASFTSLIGKPVVDINGDHIGDVEALYYRELRNVPEWAAVSTGLVDRKRVLVPLEGVTIGDRVEVPYPKDVIEHSPPTEAQALDDEPEMALYTHYSARRILPGVESERHPESVKLRMWAPPGGGN